jgi:cytochrome c-type biogenesis protein CcmH/NrfG
MKPESWVLGIAGVVFGLLVGWIIANQMAHPTGDATVAASGSATPSSSGSADAQPQNPAGGQGSAAATLDEARVRDLTAQANQRPKDAAVRAQLGNLYFDAERYSESVKWYEASLAIDQNNADVSTDLGVSYYYTNQTDRALQQFARSLAINPTHTKTMLNIGMVKAFGKQDLAGAAEAWRKVVELAPDSPEGRAARQALETLRQAHPAGAGAGVRDGAGGGVRGGAGAATGAGGAPKS